MDVEEITELVKQVYKNKKENQEVFNIFYKERTYITFIDDEEEKDKFDIILDNFLKDIKRDYDNKIFD